MYITVSARATINAEIADVFEYLSNLKYHYLWNPQVFSISNHNRVKLGSIYETESRVLGATIHSTNTVTKYDPPKELVIENGFGNVQYRARYKLTNNNNCTSVTLRITIIADPSLYNLSVPILRQLALRELRTDLQALKIAVENRLK